MAGDRRGGLFVWSPGVLMVERRGPGHRPPSRSASRARMLAIDSASAGQTSGLSATGIQTS